MSGEELDDNRYIKKLEENIVTMVNDIESKNKKKWKMLLIILFIVVVASWCFNKLYLIDIKYDHRIIGCNVENNVLNVYIKGQNVWNTDFVIKKLIMKIYISFIIRLMFIIKEEVIGSIHKRWLVY